MCFELNTRQIIKRSFSAGMMSAGICLAAGVIGALLLWIVYLLPVASMRENVAKSVPLLAAEGKYHPECNWAVSTLDNYTDSLMLLEAVYESDEGAFRNSISVPRYRVRGKDDYESFCDFSLDSSGAETHRYARYWHGYHIFLKPFLMFGDYALLRKVNFAVQMLMTFIVLGFMLWRRLVPEALAYGAAVLMMVPPVIGSCMEFSLDFYIFSLSCLALLCFGKTIGERAQIVVFALTGAMTAYFDYLTYPIATFGMPMIMMLCRSRDGSLPDDIWKLVLCFECWLIGYAGTWGLKWVYATAFTNENIILDAFNMIMNRTSTTVSYAGEIGLHKMYGEVLANFTGSPFVYVWGGALVVCPVLALLFGRRRLTLAKVVPVLVVAGLPFAWYAFARNHSFIHSYFTCKGLVVAFFAVPCSVLQMLSFKTKKEGSI